MKNLRIFLTSDIHLGLKFSGYPEIQKKLADARFKTLEKCVLRANEEKCHIFAVGGDMFDKVTVAKRDVAAIDPQNFSMMPEGLVLALKEDELRDLVAYLRGSVQVSLPKE